MGLTVNDTEMSHSTGAEQHATARCTGGLVAVLVRRATEKFRALPFEGLNSLIEIGEHDKQSN